MYCTLIEENDNKFALADASASKRKAADDISAPTPAKKFALPYGNFVRASESAGNDTDEKSSNF